MSTWHLHPGAAAGPVQLGATRASVRALLGEPPIERARKAPSDLYPEVHVHYDAGERCVAVEVWPELGPVLDGLTLLTVPYISVVRFLRARDPLLDVPLDRSTSTALGIGIDAPAGIHAPRAPASSVIVFTEGYYGDLLDSMLPPSVIAVRDTSFAELSALMAAAGWSLTVLMSLPPLVAGEPELAEFRRAGETVRTSFDPVVELRTLALDQCHAATAHTLSRTLRRWAPVDAAAALAHASGAPELLWGLALTEVLATPSLLEHAAPYATALRPVIAAAARRAIAAIRPA